MQYNIVQQPSFSMVKITFDAPGETLLLESQAMVAKDTQVHMEANMKGGLVAAAKRKMLGGESIFQNTFKATAPGQQLWFAPSYEGDVVPMRLDNSFELMISSGGFLAAHTSVKLDTQWGGAKGFFSGAGLFLLKASGVGDVFFSSYGGIHAMDIGVHGGPAAYIVDTSHIVAFTGGLNYTVQKVGGYKSLFLSGEGLVCRFEGQGRLWISTRSPDTVASFVRAFRPIESNK